MTDKEYRNFDAFYKQMVKLCPVGKMDILTDMKDCVTLNREKFTTYDIRLFMIIMNLIVAFPEETKSSVSEILHQILMRGNTHIEIHTESGLGNLSLTNRN
jgi:hypothetical protein